MPTQVSEEQPMRRRLLLLAASVLLLTAGSSAPFPGSPHWKRHGDQVYIAVVFKPSAYPVKAVVRRAMADWSAARYVQLIQRETCPSRCIVVRGTAMNGGRASVSWDGDGHIWRTGILLDNSLPIDRQRRNAACHELGHTLGLAHGTTAGPCVNGRPTAWDLALVDKLHSHRH
jgi:hypothetical protein